MRRVKLNNINEAEGKTASFAFGRMNPPTIGHKKLADAVLAQAGDPYIFLSQSQKPQTDPLDFATKLKFAQKFFPGITVGDPEVKTIIQALTKLDQLGYDNIIYIAGSDRIADFTELLNQYNGQPDKKGNVAYKFNDIQVVSAGERDPDAEGAEGMSASKMRAAAAAGEFEAFASGTPDPKLAKPMYDAVRSGMGIAESTYSQRMLKVIETLSDLNRINPFDQETNTYILEQVSKIKEHLSFQKKDKDLSEAYSPEIDDKWMEREIRATAKKHGIDPNVAVRVWRSEGGSSKNYQSKIKRSGKGSVGGQEASYGPYQLYTGGGLGNEYQEKYGVDLSADNSPEGLQRQIDFALGKAKKVGWKPWYGAAKAGIGDRDGIDGTQYADAGNIATDASVDNSGPSDFGAAFAAARAKHGGAGGKFKYQGKEYQTNVKGEKYVTNPVSVNEAFDSPYPLVWEGNPNGDSSALAEIPTSNGNAAYLDIEFNTSGDSGRFDISFTRNSRSKASGTGDEFRVFATVIEAIKQWWNKVDQDRVVSITFSAAKNTNDSAMYRGAPDSPRRHILYSRFAKQFAKQIGFKLNIEDLGIGVYFFLTNPKSLSDNKLEEAFDTKVEWVKELGPSGSTVYATKVEDAYIELTYRPVSKGVYISFTRGGVMSVTGEGSQNKIFGAVINHIKQWAAKNKPEQIMFSAFKPRTGAFGSQDSTRSGLYRKIVQRFANQNGYEYDVEDTGNEDTFILKRQGVAEGKKTNKAFVKPQFDVEWEEAARYPYLQKLGSEGWEELAKTGRAVRVTTDSVKKIGNTGADGSESLDDLEPEKVARLKQAMDSGTVEMPIVVKQPDGSLELIAGNTRLIGLISTQGEAQVWLVDASTLTEVTIDNKNGRGAVPNNQEVDYFGMRVKMKPSTFITLASKLGKDPEPEMIDYIKKGGAIGAPFLVINVPWDEDDDSKLKVRGHEGRNRMLAILKAEGDAPVETHLFFDGKYNRARHLEPEFIAAINKELISQDNQIIKGPLWENGARIVKGVSINPGHPKGPEARATVKDIAEAAYPGNLGFEEVFKFFADAGRHNPKLVDMVQKLIDQGHNKEAWKIIQDFVKVKLQGKEFSSESQLNERATDIVYHYTNIGPALNILKSGEFQLSSVAGSVEQDINPKGYNFFLSTARSKGGEYHRRVGDSAVMFVLNGRWISDRYRVKPVDYWAGFSNPSRNKETEDRIFSKDPTMPIAPVTSIHVLLKEQHPFASAKTRQFLIRAKALGIPTYLYKDESAWRLQNTAKAANVEQMKSELSGPEKFSSGGSGSRWLLPWLEVIFGKTDADLGKKAKDLVRSFRWYHSPSEPGSTRGDDHGLGNELNNARKPGNADREDAVKILKFMQQNRMLTHMDLVNYLVDKWKVKDESINEMGVGRVVKGVNTTPDVGPNEIKVQASKMGFKVDKDGRPPVLERGSIGVPLSSGLTVNVAPHRELKIKKSTKGRLNYENPRTNRQPKSKRGATV